MRVGDVLQSRFEIQAHTATGGMGTVYRGLDRESNTAVAIKVLQGGAVTNIQRFDREIAMLAKLDHPRIVGYIAAGETERGRRYLVTEWVEGISLRDYMGQVGLTPADSVQVARHIAEALTEAHRCGIVHRDIKPDNIVLEGGEIDRLRLLDFGVARDMVTISSLTRVGTMVGTPSYMAPEQAQGRPDVDARADVFALGCILYECLAGQRAFPGANLIAVRTKVIMCRPTDLARRCPEAPEALVSLVDQMLAKDRDERPDDALEVRSALEAVGDVPGAPIRQVSDSTPTDVMSESRTPSLEPERMRNSLTCIVLAAPVEEEADEDIPTRTIHNATPADMSSLRADLTQLGARLVVLEDGAVVVTLASRGDASDCAARAARAALLVKRRLPDHSVALASFQSDSPEAPELSLERAIDWGAQALEASELEAIFADFRPGPDDDRVAINIDELVASLLPSEFRVERRGEGFVLLGGPPAS